MVDWGQMEVDEGMFGELFRASYWLVDGHCGCGEDTCCYGCIANYYNQSEQSKLARGDAKEILGKLLGVIAE